MQIEIPMDYATIVFGIIAGIAGIFAVAAYTGKRLRTRAEDYPTVPPQAFPPRDGEREPLK